MARALLSVAAVLLAASVSLAAKPEDVLKKAIEAHGGADVLNKYPAGTSNMKGNLTVAGMEFPFTGSLAFAVPGKVRLEIQAEAMGMKMTVTQIINGEKVIQLENGKESNISDTMREELRQSPGIQEMSLLTPLLDPKKYTLSAGKDEDVDGKSALAVDVKPKGQKDVTLYFDAKSGLLVKMKRKALNPLQMEVTEESTFTDFQKAAGMVVPMKLDVKHDGKAFMSVTVSDYKPLEKLDDKIFKAAD